MQVIEKFQPQEGDDPVLKIITDENLQDLSLSKYAELKKLAEEKHFSVAFAYGDDRNQTLNEISLDQAGKILTDRILTSHNHPTIEKITQMDDGKTVEDHLAEIFAPAISKDISKVTKWYSEAAENHTKYNEKSLKYLEKEIAHDKKAVESSSDKKDHKYIEALSSLTHAEKNKSIIDNDNKDVQMKAKILAEYGPEIKKLADSYLNNNDKSLLSHPYFAVVMGLMNEHDYNSKVKEVEVGTEEFTNKIDLSKK
ncbi:hypothetical protein HXX01_00375 [Candidatus Nomurabacteria bacterium]|nr:hypothetical protein [Candidatus Nomurabacteria bacterium]